MKLTLKMLGRKRENLVCDFGMQKKSSLVGVGQLGKGK